MIVTKIWLDAKEIVLMSDDPSRIRDSITRGIDVPLVCLQKTDGQEWERFDYRILDHTPIPMSAKVLRKEL